MLVAMLGGLHAVVRAALAQQTATPAWREAEKVLVDERASEELKVAACRVIGRAGAGAMGAQNELIRCAGDGQLHFAAMNALRAINEDRTLLTKYLVYLLQQGGEPANAAADALADLGKDAEPAQHCAGIGRARDLLLTAVGQRDWVVRERLAPAMANRLTPPTLLATLTQLSQSPDSLVQLQRSLRLAQIGETVPTGVSR